MLARHAVQRLVPRTGQVPWGTFLVNVSGAFAMGVLLLLMARKFNAPMWLQEKTFVGFLGGYTTLSAFSVETYLLLEQRHVLTATLYALGSVVAGLVAFYAGMETVRLLA